ncbi:hypothetical protein V6U89_29825 [Micromonospora sp. CPCC 206171]|uniref:hypothetical protein n=1 Tax=Micromonospora sp. CPCC 206171 TaxID=3122405 RepID=UPI002FF08967
MALGDSYATLAEFKSYITSYTSNSSDAEITECLTAASREIERYCYRQFNSATTPTTRFYETRNIWTLLVDDFHTTTGLVVKVGDTTLTAEQYKVEAPSLTAAGDPYYRIRARDGYNWPVYYGAHEVEVTAAWGWAAVPTAVHKACMVLANETLLVVRDYPFGISTKQNGATFARSNPAVAKWLAPYRRLDGVVA